MMEQPPSLQGIVRRRQRASFVGRDGQLAAYRENLSLALDDDRKRFIFNVHGDGGVGKTYLVQQLRRLAREHGAVEAYTDEYVFGIPETMARFADQLGEPMCAFRKRFDAYEKRREQMVQDPQAPLTMWSRVTRAGIKVGLHATKAVPGAGVVVDLIDADVVADAADHVRQYLSRKFSDSGDVRLLLNPVDELTPDFLQGIRDVAAQRTVALFLDTYERTAPILDAWLLDILGERFGSLPAAFVMTISGREPLRAGRWTDYLDILAAVPLQPFTETEARQLMAVKGVTDERTVQAIWRYSRGLPLLVAMLAEADLKDPSEVDDPSGTAVERFLKWEQDPQRREAALLGALPRSVDGDVLSILAPHFDTSTVISWLRGLPFVTARAGRLEYHDVVRLQMNRMQRIQSPQGWRAAHRSLAESHERWRTEMDQDANWASPLWLHHRAEETYHLLCARHVGATDEALELAVTAATAGISTARRWAEVFRAAGEDADDETYTRWGDQLLAQVDEHRTDCSDYLAALLVSGSLSPKARVVALVERGKLSFFAGRNEQAVADLDLALEIAPANSRANGLRGAARLNLEMFSAALSDLDEAIRLDPEYTWAWGYRGETYRLMDRYDEALANYTHGIKLDPTDAWIVTGRGQTFRSMGRYDEALADFTSAIELDRELASAWTNRGEAYQLVERYDEALADCTHGIQLDPTDPWIVIARGQVYLAMERYDEGLADFTHAIDLDRDSAWSWANRGETYRLIDRYDEASVDFTHAIELDPEHAWALGSRAQTYQAMERYADALVDFARAIELDPTLAWVWGSRGETYHEMERYDEALADYTRAIELDPGHAWRGRRAQTYRAMERYDEALADQTCTIELNPTSAFARIQRGETHRLAEHYDAALADYTRAIELDPSSAWAFAYRGETHRLMDRYDAALADLRQAIELDPEDAWALGGRAQAYQAMGRYDEALADFTHAIELSAQSVWMMTGRAKVYRAIAHYPEAVADALAVSRSEDADASDLYMLGVVLTAINDPQADAVLASAQRRAHVEVDSGTGPATADAHLTLSLCALVTGDVEGAANLFRQIPQRHLRVEGLLAVRDEIEFIENVISGNSKGVALVRDLVIMALDDRRDFRG